MSSPPALHLAEAYLHRLDPIIVDLFGVFPIRWYGTAYLVGFVIAWLLLRWMASSRRILLSGRQVDDFMFLAVVGVMVGGRVGYAIGYDPPLLWTFSTDFPFWSLLALNQGGMSSHGGVLGVILISLWFAWSRKLSALHVFDAAALTCTPGLGLGRVANFINAELWGKAIPASMQSNPPWWSVKYPDELLAPGFNVSERLGEVGREIDRIVRTQGVDPDNTFLFLRDQLVAGKETIINLIQPHLTAYYPSQLIQALTDGPILFCLLALIWLRPRTPGVIGGWFMLAYGLMRLITEYWFRQPDADVDLIIGLQRGQLLSIPMVIIGIGMLIYAARSTQPKVGGLLKPAPTEPDPDDEPTKPKSPTG